MTTRKQNRSAKTNRQLAKAAERVRQALGLETLADRKRDALDFHDLSVASIREAIQIAFDAGYDAGYDAGVAAADALAK